MTHKNLYELSVTTQGPTYPPSEVMDGDGNFIVIGRVNRRGPAGECLSKWSQAIVSTNCVIPAFGEKPSHFSARPQRADDGGWKAV
jgi:hypothetical protein